MQFNPTNVIYDEPDVFVLAMFLQIRDGYVFDRRLEIKYCIVIADK